MTLRTVALRLSAAFAVLAIAGMTASVARADSGPAYGWWWAEQSDLQVLPPPPWVPPDGMYVAARPDGTDALSALRFSLPPDVSPQTLTLAVSSMQGTPTIEICPTAGPWKPQQAGAWSQRPSVTAAQSACVAGVASTDGKQFTFAVRPALVRNDTLDVAVQPRSPSGTTLTAFYVAFSKPGAQSLDIAPLGTTESTPENASTPLTTTPVLEPATNPTQEAIAPEAGGSSASLTQTLSPARATAAAPASSSSTSVNYQLIWAVPLLILAGCYGTGRFLLMDLRKPA